MTYIFELVAFVLVVLFLYRFVWTPKGRLRDLMQARQEAIARQIKEADEARERLERTEQEFRDRLAATKDEAARINAEAEDEGKAIVEELREQAEAEAQRIRERAEEQLVTRRNQLILSLRADVGRLAMGLADEVVVAALRDETARRRVADRFIAELDALEAPSAANAASAVTA